jgi:hypothetical protein
VPKRRLSKAPASAAARVQRGEAALQAEVLH